MSEAMSSVERVRRALNFELPDRVPIFDSFWAEFTAAWRAEKNPPEGADIRDYYGVDITIAVGDESLAPTRAETLEETDQYVIRRDGWGRVIRTIPGGYFYEQLEPGLQQPADLSHLHVDPPDLEVRYQSLDARIEQLKQRFCVFAKTGGPYIRTHFVRDEPEFLMDMAADPVFARELAMWMADHLTAIGLEELRRWDLYDNGLWIFDDMASNQGPMFSPRTAEQILAPAWSSMVQRFKAAGAQKVILHSDGNIGPLLDLFLDLGFDGINPVEPKAGLDAVALREKYGDRLVLIGGLCNAQVLPEGNPEKVRQHVKRVLSAGKDGGLIIGTHSIGPDISVATYDLVNETVRELGRYPMGWC